MICHSLGPLWGKVTHNTERLATELNTGRKRHKIPWGEEERLWGSNAKVWGVQVVLMLVPWVFSSACAPEAVVCVGCAGSVWAVQHWQVLPIPPSSAGPLLELKMLWWASALSLASRAGAPWSHVCHNMKTVNGKYCLEKPCSTAHSLCLNITRLFLAV